MSVPPVVKGTVPPVVKRNPDGTIHAYVRVPLPNGVESTGMAWVDLKPGDPEYDAYNKWLNRRTLGSKAALKKAAKAKKSD